MFGSRVIFSLPLLCQQLFYCPPPPPTVEEELPVVIAQATTHVVLRRTVYYQSKFQPVPVVEPVAEPVNIAQATTHIARRRTVFYQAFVKPPAPLAAAVEVTVNEWFRQFTRAPTRPVNDTSRFTYFSPAPPLQVTPDEWLQPFRRNVAGPFPRPTQPVLEFAPIAQVTPDEWLQPFQRQIAGPYPRNTQPTFVYTPAEEVTLTTTLEWLPAWQSAARSPPVRHTQPVLGYPYEAVVVEAQPPDRWLQPFYKAVPRPATYTGLYTPFVPKEATRDNTIEGSGWDLTIDGWGAAPRVQPRQGGSPFVPAEATLENTVPLGGWMRPLSVAVPYPKPVKQLAPFVPAEATRENTVTPDKWMQAWRGPPRIWPVKVQAVPFVPEEATLENTLGHVAWLQPFYKAVPPPHLNVTDVIYPASAPVADNTVTIEKWKLDWNLAARARPVIHTQPFYGYPYEGVDNTRTEWDWTIAWQGPPRYTPPRILAQPFVPREATIENTLGHVAWLQPFYKAAPTPPVRHTQPVFGYPYEFASNLTTSIEWLQKWQGPPRIWPLGKPYQPFVPREATRENTITGIAWLQAFKGPPRYTPLKVAALPFVPKEFVRDVVTPDKWLAGFQASKPRKPVHTQPLYSFRVAPTLTTSIEWLRQWQGPPRYTSRLAYQYQPFIPPAATIENTVTIDKWKLDWNLAAPPTRPRHTQPFYGYPYEGIPSVFEVHVTASLTIELEQMLRYVCRVEQADAFVEGAEQADLWATQAEAVENIGLPVCYPVFDEAAFQDDAFDVCVLPPDPPDSTEATDPWAAVSEQADPWGVAGELPRPGCCDEVSTTVVVTLPETATFNILTENALDEDVLLTEGGEDLFTEDSNDLLEEYEVIVGDEVLQTEGDDPLFTQEEES